MVFNGSVPPVAATATFESRIPDSQRDLVLLVATLLGEAPEDIDPAENLIECGIDSLNVMRVVDSWNRRGLGIKFAELFERPTIADWWQLVCARTPEISPEAVVAAVVDESAPFDLSPIQHAYWVGRGDDQPLGGVGCHVYLEIDGGGVDPARLEHSVRAVAERHAMLRVRILGDGTQQIVPRPDWPGLRVHDLRDSDRAAAELSTLRDALSHRRLDVEHGEVFDVQLSLLPNGSTRLHVELDLLVADVLSFNIFLNDLAAAYRGDPEALRPLSYSFPRYRTELTAQRAAAVEGDRAYWTSRLADLPAAPPLPLAVDPERVVGPRFRRIARWLEPAAYLRLTERAREHQVTVAMMLATAFAEVLGRWSGTSRLLLNVPVFDRKTLHPDVSEMIADFTNLVLLEVDLGAPGFADRVRRTQRQFQTDISHTAYSGLDVLRDLARNGDGHAGAPVVFASNLNSGDLLSPDFRESFGELGFMVSQTPQVWLDHQLMEMDGGLYLNWDYVPELFAEGVVEGMFDAYCGVLEWLSYGDWSAPVPIELPQDQRAVRGVVGATEGLESGRLLHEAFFQRAEADPARPALLWDEDGEMSYGELADWALRVAGGLVADGVRPGDLVGVTVPKGPAQVAAIFGVLAAGAGYVPVGIDQPAVRRELMLGAAGVQHVVADAARGPWPAGVRVISPTEPGGTPLPGPVGVGVSGSAYVIFTSGSTGQPKGVEVSHRAAVNTVEDVNERFGVDADDRVLAVSAADFDLSVYDLFGLLGVGGALVLVGEQDRREARRWVELCRRHDVTVWNSAPALFDMYLTTAEAEAGEVADRIRLVLVSGDWVGLDLPGRYRSRCAGGRFVALGGATEAAIWSNAFEVDQVGPEWRSIPYGFPLRNQCYRVVDTQGRDCPDWVAGELWIGGVGLAEGYRGDAAKTEEKFVWWQGRRWYRTGDMGRFWADGTLEFLGRFDHQIKVRGHRIELGEIESALEAHPHIDRAVATTIGTGAHRKLAAAVTAAETAEPATDEVELWLRDRLPAHMVPEQFAVIAVLPLTPNGKVDRAAVATVLEQQDITTGQEAEPPRGRMEQLVAELWVELLPIDRATRTDNFFRCGGDSLIGTRLVARLGAAGIEGAELRGLFANPTLAGFAATLELGNANVVGFEPDPAARYDPFPVTDVQLAYLMGRRPEFTLGGIGCHFYSEFDGSDIDLARLQQAWNTLIERHDMLRTIFDGNVHQWVLPSVPEFVIEVTDADAADADTALAELREDMAHRTFEPGEWPLFDVRAVRYGDRVRIGVGLDNLIVDALSIFILFAELELLYWDPAAPLRPVGITFRDYELNTRPSAEDIAAARDYWLDLIDRLPPPPELPLAIEPGRIETPRFARRETHIDQASWARITERTREYEITPSALLLACYAEVLGAWSTQQDMTLTLTTFQRDPVHPDIDNILGEFTSLLLVAYEPEPGSGLAARARGLQEQIWRGLDHQAVSATWALREMGRRAGVAEVSMPVVFTSALGVLDGMDTSGASAFAEVSWEISHTPQVSLDLQVREYADGVSVSWDFVEGLFADGVIDQMFAAYCAALDWVAGGDWATPLPLRLPQRNSLPIPRAESGRPLHGGFFEWAEREPGRVALVWGEDGELSYGTLAAWALQVAGGLVACGVRRGDVVGVTLPKGPAQVASILGVLAAGAAYVPVGVDQPVARRDRMFASAGVRYVVADEASGGWPENMRVISPAAPDGTPLPGPVGVDVSGSAYVIFTSGSTGEPKGVEVSHRAAMNTLDDINERFGVGADDRALALSAADFDLSVYDLFGLLSVGGALVLIGEQDRREARRWVELCRRHEVTVWNSVPALFDMYLTAAEADGTADQIRLVLLAGDWVGMDLPVRYRARSAAGRFVALGGPTETAIWSNAYEVTEMDPEWRSIPYGFALHNQCHRVVDTQGRDCPDWVAGELWIGGVCVAQGYRGDAAKTAEKFVSWQGQRWYRSGDVARFWPDGTLEFLGRLDHQVKVRGHRIELGEIESALEAHPYIDSAVATTVGTGVHRKLAAAVTAAHSGATPATDGMAELDRVLDGGVDEALTTGGDVEAAIVEARIAALLAAGLESGPAPVDDIAAALGVADDFRNLLVLWLDWLVERDVLTAHSGRFGTGARWDEARDPAVLAANVAAAEGTWMHSVAERLAVADAEVTEILRGDRSPLTLLEDPVLAPESLVAGQPDVGAAIGRIARTITGLAARLGRPVRVAELGCRTGMAARHLLDGLDSEHIELTLLDPSPRLLDLAAQRLDGLPHSRQFRAMTGGVLPQDLRNHFDVVVTVVALHRYRDPVDGALEAADLLVPRGLLVGIEHSELAPIGLLTAALLERGFGGGRRSPMLDKARWADVLTAADLSEIDIAERDDSALLLLTARSAVDRPVLDAEQVLARLRGELPTHMVPDRLTVLPRLPLSARDKVDRKRVAELLSSIGDGEEAGEPPRTEVEKAIAELWAGLLPGAGADIGRHTNFFAIGGDSLTATHFAEAVRRQFGVVLRLRQMFAEPTVAAVADTISAQLDESMEDGEI
ncbi:non-ribosomal peptide synthetase [Nocardia iowensis]|uniref:Phenyloxazoline synthase MbtB n=1 Tax=Nocardia iowensis TaxID=204891 RepID=A0ABX8RM48_NOCIO|nr:non-ribosomal peptide synthetase [Nocardia iowensis]QXN90704.1 amino acid adenylation domain-containing protein [Nocardia iowensis]